ncbi:hypothetical protein [Sulfitobacter alexandrii]|nr:hypothetical protein [Sulfitobacter alexandrii]
MTHGYATKVGRDGLITVVPKRRRRGFPFKLLMMFALGFLGLKVFMVASVGPVTYNERLAKLESGTAIERAGAKVLSIDPVTEKLSAMTGPVLR